MNENRFDSEQGRFVVQSEGSGAVGIVDTSLDKPVANPWLEAVARDIFSREDLGSRKVYLTNDLRCVIVSLQSGVRVHATASK